MSTESLRAALAELVAATDPQGDTPVEGWKSAWRKARTALAQPLDDGMCPNCVTPWKCNGPHIAPAAPAVQRADEPVAQIPEGWVFNHAQEADTGIWDVGFLDPEDDRFSSIISVDTGNYYQPQHAEPIARALLAFLSAPAAPAYVPLSPDDIQDSVHEAGLDWHRGWTAGDAPNRYEALCRAIESLVVARMQGERI